MKDLAALLRFDGKHVVVTGGANGIGAKAAELFVRQGAQVTICDIEADALSDTAARIHARALVYDQADPQSVLALAARLESVDVLVNNAGVLLVKPLLACEQHDVSHIFNIDVHGAIALALLLGKTMVARRRGVIVNVSSQTACCGGQGRALYASAKAAMMQFTRSAAAEWGCAGVRVVGVAPGRCHTRMTTNTVGSGGPGRGIERVPLGRWGQPEEPAYAMVFLASDAAAYITGTTLLVDGGYVIG